MSILYEPLVNWSSRWDGFVPSITSRGFWTWRWNPRRFRLSRRWTSCLSRSKRKSFAWRKAWGKIHGLLLLMVVDVDILELTKKTWWTCFNMMNLNNPCVNLEDPWIPVVDAHYFRMGKLMRSCKITAGPVLKPHRDLKFMFFLSVLISIHWFWSKFKKVFASWNGSIQWLLDARNQKQMIYAPVVKEFFSIYSQTCQQYRNMSISRFQICFNLHPGNWALTASLVRKNKSTHQPLVVRLRSFATR